MSDDKKSCGATPVSFRLFSSPEFLVKFTHSTKPSKVAANEVDDKLQREIGVVAARRIKPPSQVDAASGRNAQIGRDATFSME